MDRGTGSCSSGSYTYKSKVMVENRIYTGIDISAATFTASIGGEVREFKNNNTGYVQFDKWAGIEAIHVMEASGPYFLGLAMHLHGKGRTVSVVNPLVIRHYGRMKFMRAKTDRKDAKLIESFGREQTPDEWTPPSKEVDELNQILSAIGVIEKGKRQILNNLGANMVNPRSAATVREELQGAGDYMEQRIKRLWSMATALIKQHFRQEDQLLQSIPGIGPKTSAALLATLMRTGEFESAKQLQAFFGLAPKAFDSGSSVRGRRRIDKLGNAEVRRLLYMAAISAKRYNPSCRQLHDRLLVAGKKKKVIYCAVAAKLARQVFAVLKHKEPFRAIGNFAPVRAAS
jgi:transposase